MKSDKRVSLNSVSVHYSDASEWLYYDTPPEKYYEHFAKLHAQRQRERQQAH